MEHFIETHIATITVFFSDLSCVSWDPYLLLAKQIWRVLFPVLIRLQKKNSSSMTVHTYVVIFVISTSSLPCFYSQEPYLHLSGNGLPFLYFCFGSSGFSKDVHLDRNNAFDKYKLF